MTEGGGRGRVKRRGEIKNEATKGRRSGAEGVVEGKRMRELIEDELKKGKDNAE